jgi:hypothetical protein
MSRRPGVALATAVILLPLAVWVVLHLTGHDRLPVDVVVERIELKSPAPAAGAPGGGLLSRILERVGDLATTLAGERELTVTLRVHNRSPVPVTLRAARYALSVGPREILAGNWRPETVAPTCTAGADFSLEITIKPDAGNAVGMVWEKLKDRGAPVRLHGEVDATVLGLTVTRPFEVEHLDFDLLGTPGLRGPAAGETPESPGAATGEPQAAESPKTRI